MNPIKGLYRSVKVVGGGMWACEPGETVCGKVVNRIPVETRVVVSEVD